MILRNISWKWVLHRGSPSESSLWQQNNVLSAPCIILKTVFAYYQSCNLANLFVFSGLGPGSWDCSESEQVNFGQWRLQFFVWPFLLSSLYLRTKIDEDLSRNIMNDSEVLRYRQHPQTPTCTWDKLGRSSQEALAMDGSLSYDTNDL